MPTVKPAKVKTVKVRYVGPLGEVYLPSLDDLTVAHGQEVDVPTEAAGNAPAGEPGTLAYVPGTGLLAQVDNWELVAA